MAKGFLPKKLVPQWTGQQPDFQNKVLQDPHAHRLRQDKISRNAHVVTRNSAAVMISSTGTRKTLCWFEFFQRQTALKVLLFRLSGFRELNHWFAVCCKKDATKQDSPLVLLIHSSRFSNKKEWSDCSSSTRAPRKRGAYLPSPAPASGQPVPKRSYRTAALLIQTPFHSQRSLRSQPSHSYTSKKGYLQMPFW